MTAIRTGLDYTAAWLLLDKYPPVAADPDDAWTHFGRLQWLESLTIAIDNIKSDGKNVVAQMNELITRLDD